MCGIIGILGRGPVAEQLVDFRGAHADAVHDIRAEQGDEEIALLRCDAGADAGRGAGTAPLLITAVDELLDDSGLSDETYRALSASFDERQLMDLVFTVGTYALLAMAFNSFGLELDPGLSAHDFERET